MEHFRKCCLALKGRVFPRMKIFLNSTSDKHFFNVISLDFNVRSLDDWIIIIGLLTVYYQ